MTAPTPETPGTPHRPGTPSSRSARYGTLNRAVIVAAARTIADEEGLDRLTLRRIAEALETGQASLYRHLGGRGELVALLCEDLASGMPVDPDGGTSPEAALRQWETIHQYLARHPWGARAIAEGEHVAESGQSRADQLIGQFERLGLSRTDAERAYRAFWHLLLGHLLNDHPLGHDHGGSPESTRDTVATRRETDFRWAVRHLLNGVVGERP